MDELFQYGRKGILRYMKKNLVPILYTLIFHLVVLIILVFAKVEALKNDQELGVSIEFEEKTLEELIEEEMLDVPADWLEEVLRQRELSSNRAVNLNAENKFTEDISTDEYVNDLLDQIEEARKLEDREKLEELQAILASADYVPPSAEDNKEQAEYSGPTTITFEFLNEPRNRGKVKLSIPVYRCQGSGLVKVEVTVAPDGTVREAQVLEPIQGSDRVCFSDAALAAARSSQFRIELNGPDKHVAIITYSFIAQ
jgi:Gram-negative bacterial TonB protein C-terminal